MEEQIMNIEGNEAIDTVEAINTKISGKGIWIALGVAATIGAAALIVKKFVAPAIENHKAKKEAQANAASTRDYVTCDEPETCNTDK